MISIEGDKTPAIVGALRPPLPPSLVGVLVVGARPDRRRELVSDGCVELVAGAVISIGRDFGLCDLLTSEALGMASTHLCP
jgi:hypothetical protein